MVFVKIVEILPDHTKDMTFDGLLAVHLVAQHLELEEEMLLVFQSASGLLDFDVARRQVDLIVGVTARNQLLLLNEGFRERLGYVFVDLLQDEFLHLGDGTSSEAMVFHLLGGVVDALQAFTDERVFRVVFLDFGVDEVEVVVELARFAEKHILHIRLEAVLDPFQSTKPHHLDAARLVAKEPRGACGPRCPNHLDVGNGSHKLIIHRIVVNVGHLLDLAAVDITERKLVEHILIGMHAQLFLKDFSLFRPNALQISNTRLEEVLFHATKVRIFSNFAAMKTPFVDIHTHNARANDNLIQIVNLDLSQPCPKQGYYSYGIHPWALDDADFQVDEALNKLKENLQRPQVIALGEAGLDKMHKVTFEQQIELFERQIELSETLQKPMILHDVRSHNEIIALRKKHKAQQPWILHGFSGTEQDIKQLIGQGIYLSVGESLMHPERKIHKSFKFINLDYLFLETDMVEIRIETIYEAAANMLEMDLSALKTRIFANFARLFKL